MDLVVNLQWSHPSRQTLESLPGIAQILRAYPTENTDPTTQPKCGIVIYIYITHTYKLDYHDPRTANPYWTVIKCGGFSHVELQFHFLDG